MALALDPTGALACPASETRHFSCSFGGGSRTVEVCHNRATARYRFGPTGHTPELELVRSLAEVDLTPWPGVGRTIWEEVSFRNADHVYVVYGSIDRAPPANGSEGVAVTVSGGITIRRDDEEIATLTCDPGSVMFPWDMSLFDAKEAAGQCFDQSGRMWETCAPAE